MIRLASLIDIFEEMGKSRLEWHGRFLLAYGTVPNEIVMSKTSYMLTYCYDQAHGLLGCGNWLNLDLDIGYSAIVNHNMGDFVFFQRDDQFLEFGVIEAILDMEEELNFFYKEQTIKETFGKWEKSLGINITVN